MVIGVAHRLRFEVVVKAERNRLTSEGGQVDLIWSASSKLPVGAGSLCRFEAGEQHQVVRHHRGPDVGLEVIESAPGTACQTIGSLEAGNPGLDPRAEVAQLAINQRLLTMSSTARPRFLWKATSVTPRALAAVRLSWLA